MLPIAKVSIIFLADNRFQVYLPHDETSFQDLIFADCSIFYIRDLLVLAGVCKTSNNSSHRENRY